MVSVCIDNPCPAPQRHPLIRMVEKAVDMAVDKIPWLIPVYEFPETAESPVAEVIGIFSQSPPSFLKSRVPVEYSTAPEQRNKRDLKKA